MFIEQNMLNFEIQQQNVAFFLKKNFFDKKKLIQTISISKKTTKRLIKHQKFTSITNFFLINVVIFFDKFIKHLIRIFETFNTNFKFKTFNMNFAILNFFNNRNI